MTTLNSTLEIIIPIVTLAIVPFAVFIAIKTGFVSGANNATNNH